MNYGWIKRFFIKKGALPFAIFWIVGISIITGRLCFDIRTYCFGITLCYRNVSKSGYDYLLHLPKGYTDFDGTRPLMIYLHGAGEVGKDAKILKRCDVVHYAKGHVAAEEFPFIVVSPMSSVRGWNSEKVVLLLNELLADQEKRWRMNDQKVYLTGFSMGGRGTFSVACDYPERFAAIVPVAGCGDPEKASKLKNVPTWAFHGDADEVMPYECSSNMIEAMKATDCTEAKLTMLKGAGHGIIDNVYSDPSVFRWLLEKMNYGSH